MQDTSSIKNRYPLPPIPTTRTFHIPDPDSVLQYISSCSHRKPTATKTIRKTPIPKLPKNTPIPSTSQTPIKTIPEHTTTSPSEISSFTFSQLYPILERLKSITTSALTDFTIKIKTMIRQLVPEYQDIDITLVLNHEDFPKNYHL